MYPFSGKTSKNLLIFIHFSIDISPLDFVLLGLLYRKPKGKANPMENESVILTKG